MLPMCQAVVILVFWFLFWISCFLLYQFSFPVGALVFSLCLSCLIVHTCSRVSPPPAHSCVLLSCFSL